MSVLVAWAHIKPGEHPFVRVTDTGTVEIRLDATTPPGSDASVVAFLTPGILDHEERDAWLEQAILQMQAAREVLALYAFHEASGYLSEGIQP